MSPADGTSRQRAKELIELKTGEEGSEYNFIRRAVLTHCHMNGNPCSNQEIRVLFKHGFKILQISPELFT